MRGCDITRDQPGLTTGIKMRDTAVSGVIIDPAYNSTANDSNLLKLMMPGTFAPILNLWYALEETLYHQLIIDDRTKAL